jgi:hypothetical protein
MDLRGPAEQPYLGNSSIASNEAVHRLDEGMYDAALRRAMPRIQKRGLFKSSFLNAGL